MLIKFDGELLTMKVKGVYFFSFLYLEGGDALPSTMKMCGQGSGRVMLFGIGVSYNLQSYRRNNTKMCKEYM